MSPTEILENWTNAKSQGKGEENVFKVYQVETQQGQGAPNWHLAPIPESPTLAQEEANPIYFVWCICQNKKHQQKCVPNLTAECQNPEVGSRDSRLKAHQWASVEGSSYFPYLWHGSTCPVNFRVYTTVRSLSYEGGLGRTKPDLPGVSNRIYFFCVKGIAPDWDPREY